MRVCVYVRVCVCVYVCVCADNARLACLLGETHCVPCFEGLGGGRGLPRIPRSSSGLFFFFLMVLQLRPPAGT